MADCREGACIATNLGDNYHYQVQHVCLESYLLDIHLHKFNITIPGMNGYGFIDAVDGAKYLSYCTAEDDTDGIIYMVNTPFTVSNGKATYNKEL